MLQHTNPMEKKSSKGVKRRMKDARQHFECYLRLMFTDTDSLVYAVQTEDIYIDMAGDAATHYDFSGGTRPSPL